MSESGGNQCYSIADLRSWKEQGCPLDPPAGLAVIGDPVEHSLSPQLHNPGLAAAGLGFQYVRVHLLEEELPEALGLFAETGFIGINVTIPHKGAIFGLVDETSEVSRLTRAVNTVVFDGDRTIGHHTDGPGLEQAIREEFAVDLSDLRVLVLGAGGGAGRAASMQAASSQCQRLVLANRTFEKAKAMKEEIAPMFAGSERLLGPVDRLTAIPMEAEALQRELQHIDLIINATSMGMKSSDPALIPPNLLLPYHLVYDMVYSPSQTRLMRDTLNAGGRVTNGLSMLLWQGVYSFEFWFNQSAPVGEMRSGLIEAVNTR